MKDSNTPADKKTEKKPYQDLPKLLAISNITKTYKINKYIGEKENVLRDFLLNDKSYNIIADMNSGKTYSIIDFAVKNKIKVVMVQPLQVNVRQKAKEFERKGIKISFIHGMRKIVCREKETFDVSEILDKKETDVILCVYNSLPKLIENKKFKSSKYVLIIDESHILVTHYGYRYKEINYLIENRKKFRKTLYLTGTPEGTIDQNIPSIVFERDKSEQEKTNLTIVKYSRNGIYKVILHILNNNYEGKIVILKDNLKDLYKIKNILVEYGYKISTIKIISSAHKGTTEFALLEEEEIFSEKLKFILTTRVIAEGANIYKTSDTIVYMIDSYDFLMKRQFISRFRDGLKHIYDFLPYNSFFKPDWIDINKEFSKLKELYTIQCNTNQKILDLQRSLEIKNNSNNGFEKIKTKEINDFVYYSLTHKNYRVSEEKIKWFLINKLTERISANIFNSKTYYKEIAKFKVDTINSNELLLDIKIKPSLKEFREKLNVASEDAKDSELKKITENFRIYFTMFFERYNKTNKDLIRPNEMYFIKNLDDIVDLDFYRMDIQKKSIYNIFNRIYDLITQEYPISIIVQMIELLYWGKNIKYRSILTRFEYFHNYKAINKLPELVGLNTNNEILKQYKLTSHVLKNVNPDTRYDLYKIKNIIEKKMKELRMKISGNGFEYSSIINGIFNTSGRRQGQKKCSDKKTKVKYFIEIQKPHNINSILSILNQPITEEDKVIFEKIHTVRIKNHIVEIQNAYQNSYSKKPSNLVKLGTIVKEY